jgi:serine/threonine protein kinase
MPGDTIGPYRVIDVLGVGGTAVVLKCQDARSGEIKAVKRFFPDKLNAELEKRIKNEPQLSFHTDLIVTGEEYINDGVHNLVMPFVSGKPLSAVVATERLQEAPALYMLLCVTRAVSQVHSRNIIVADIKSDNIMLCNDARAKIIDLGCLEQNGKRATVSMGTNGYAAPELLNRDILHFSTDIYSIGMVSLEAIISNARFTALLPIFDVNIKRGFLPDLSFLSKSKLRPIIEKAIHPDWSQRYQRTEELYCDLLSLYTPIINNSSRTAGKPSRSITLVLSDGRMIAVGEQVIGREKFGDNKRISNEQIEIDLNGSGIRIKNIGLNPMYINARRIPNERWEKITENDWLRIANITMRIKSS